LHPKDIFAFSKYLDKIIQKHNVNRENLIEISKFPALDNEGGYLDIFFIPGVPPVVCLEERQFLLSEGSSGDFFSSEMPIVLDLSVSCIPSQKRQVSNVCPFPVLGVLDSAR